MLLPQARRCAIGVLACEPLLPSHPPFAVRGAQPFELYPLYPSSIAHCDPRSLSCLFRRRSLLIDGRRRRRDTNHETHPWSSLDTQDASQASRARHQRIQVELFVPFASSAHLSDPEADHATAGRPPGEVCAPRAVERLTETQTRGGLHRSGFGSGPPLSVSPTLRPTRRRTR